MECLALDYGHQILLFISIYRINYRIGLIIKHPGSFTIEIWTWNSERLEILLADGPPSENDSLEHTFYLP